MIEPIRVIDVVEHQFAAIANASPRDGMVRVSRCFDGLPVLDLQSETTARVTQTTIASPRFRHGNLSFPSLSARGAEKPKRNSLALLNPHEHQANLNF
jgi:hypothetical protein